MRKINEIFYSLQGEGHHTGYPSVFIRFSGCNLKCDFCDTLHEDGIFMNDDEIFHAVNLYSADWIVLTGGEPCLQIDEHFIKMLKRSTGKKIAIETNGTLPVPKNIDWVTISPKIGLLDGEELPLADNAADELKVVDLGQPLDIYFTLPCVKHHTLMYLQPCYVKDAERFSSNRMRTVRRVLADPRWTLSVQLHRFLGIP